MLVAKAKKRAEGMFSLPSEIREQRSFHRASRERSGTEGRLINAKSVKNCDHESTKIDGRNEKDR